MQQRVYGGSHEKHLTRCVFGSSVVVSTLCSRRRYVHGVLGLDLIESAIDVRYMARGVLTGTYAGRLPKGFGGGGWGGGGVRGAVAYEGVRRTSCVSADTVVVIIDCPFRVFSHPNQLPYVCGDS